MSRNGLRLAAVCALLSAVTTFALWLLPRLYQQPATFAETIALHANAYYMTRLWVNYGHIFLALVAYAGATHVLSRIEHTLATLGFVWFLLWGLTELLGVTVNIFAVNRTWRASFHAAMPDVQSQIRTHLVAFDAVWDAMFFLLLTAFLLGTAFFGLAALRGDPLTRTVGVLFLLAVPLTLAIMIGGYSRYSWLNAVVAAVYPSLQPISRAVMAYWLWRASRAEATTRCGHSGVLGTSASC